MEECVFYFVALAAHVGFVLSLFCYLAKEVVVHCPFLINIYQKVY